jgi:5-methylcytosine-specific restriction endonuclease McrA
VDSAVLVLNQNYDPLNVCSSRRAIILVIGGKAEVLEQNHREIRSPNLTFHSPSVIRMAYMVRRPRPALRLTRREVFIRDSYTCQYCGQQTKDLTLDHVIPRYRGGQHTWENLVSACKSCNHRKGGKTVEEARLTLLRRPFKPKVSSHYIFYRQLQSVFETGWDRYLPAAPHQILTAR